MRRLLPVLGLALAFGAVAPSTPIHAAHTALPLLLNQAFQHPSGKFAITPPKGWRKMKEGVAWQIGSDDTGAMMDVQTIKIPENKLDAWYTETQKELQKTGSKIVHKEPNAKMDGKPARVITTVRTVDKMSLIIVLVLTIRGDTGVIITTGGEAKMVEKHQKEISKSIDSFVWK